MAGDLEYKDKDVMRTLLILSQLRGEDSTGFFSVPKTGDEASITKVVGTPNVLFETKAWDVVSMGTKRVFIGHCRKSTVGPTARSTAHPFTYDHITGVHNGTLTNWRHLPGDAETTDSMTLFKNFADVGVRPTIEATEGAYALIWWDEKEGVLNVLKNKERSLTYAFSEDGKKIIFASEAWMIRVACARHGLKLMDLTPREKTIETVMDVTDDEWWKIRPGKGASKDALTFLNDHDETLKGGVNPAKYVAAPFRGYGWSPFGSDDLDDNLRDVGGKKEVPKLPAPAQQGTTNSQAGLVNTSPSTPSSQIAGSNSKTSREPKPTLTLVPTDKKSGSVHSTASGLLIGNGGLLLTPEEFGLLVEPNCVWCQAPHTYDELRSTNREYHWVDDDRFICPNCINETPLNAGVC